MRPINLVRIVACT
ncbi:hypothetical protein F383_33441 [Gossypium arboreum]|uniref:Uncharacterized protein n=1 Tax=Gossypium arboreum TaxID=29729 RepID=A0A0B0MIU8_GOSAR|nr:hypothetical protein F383_38074 [Gossypium arboreum]KHG26322.1 hypothetical protein F383_33441 [Gossypium arboreum]